MPIVLSFLGFFFLEEHVSHCRSGVPAAAQFRALEDLFVASLDRLLHRLFLLKPPLSHIFLELPLELLCEALIGFAVGAFCIGRCG